MKYIAFVFSRTILIKAATEQHLNTAKDLVVDTRSTFKLIWKINYDMTYFYHYSYREVDTRAKFLIINDKRLFEKKMHYIWNKLINVVFIRRFAGTKRYELSTVPFPTPIAEYLSVKRLDTWSQGKMQVINICYLYN